MPASKRVRLSRRKIGGQRPQGSTTSARIKARGRLIKKIIDKKFKR